MTWEASARTFIEHVANATHNPMPEKLKRLTRLKQRFKRPKEKAA